MDNSPAGFVPLNSETTHAFVRKFESVDDVSKNKLYLQFMKELQNAVVSDNIDTLKSVNWILNHITTSHSANQIQNLHNQLDNPLKGTNLIIFACKKGKDKILEFILCYCLTILENLSVKIGRETISPIETDDESHNAFYYAIRSCKTQILKTLIEKWPGNYFANNQSELDDILSDALDELKIKNVPLSLEMEVFVREKLTDLRFFNTHSEQSKDDETSLNHIVQRIELLIEVINSLTNEFSRAEVNEKFLFMVTFVAKNIHVLKNQLKATFDKIPWEEIEFCLVMFTMYCVKPEGKSLFYNSVLNRKKILSYLEIFSDCLRREKLNLKNVGIHKLIKFPQVKRDKIVENIKKDSPHLEELYKDFELIRDFHSLETIQYYTELAVSCDGEEEEGKLIIIKALQCTGEHLKNTLEAPKMSYKTKQLVLPIITINANDIVYDLRNSLSHAASLWERIKIEKHSKNFFKNIQKELRIVNARIVNILLDFKLKMMKKMLQRVIDSDRLDDMKEVLKIFQIASVKGFQTLFENLGLKQLTVGNQLEDLFDNLCKIIKNKTTHEKDLFKQIIESLKRERRKLGEGTKSFMAALFTFQLFVTRFNDVNTLQMNEHERIKSQISLLLPFVATNAALIVDVKRTCSLTVALHNCLQGKIVGENAEIIANLFEKIYGCLILEMGDIGSIEELKYILKRKPKFKSNSNPLLKIQKEEPVSESEILSHKLDRLKHISTLTNLDNQLSKTFTSFQCDKGLQIAIEMLMLDIMSILERSYFSYNPFYLDNSYPELIGRNLRNHLAHYNALVNVLFSDNFIAIFLNARKFAKECPIAEGRKIGLFTKCDPLKLKDMYAKNFHCVGNQLGLFDALVNGNLEAAKLCIENGADIHARSIDCSTALHFACQSGDMRLVKFIIDHDVDLNAKDTAGQTAVHIAAKFGRDNIVKYFVRQSKVSVHETDYQERTPLHVAAQYGRKSVVQALAEENADTMMSDKCGYSPLHYAIINNHTSIAKFLLSDALDVDGNEAAGGFTPLHFSADVGSLEMVDYLLKHNANPNALNSYHVTPLHFSAVNGYYQVVKCLILHKANVNSTNIDGMSPLHFASISGHEKVANVLLEHGADSNITNNINKSTPLHVAASEGHLKITELLLKFGANPNARNSTGKTPLHFAGERGYQDIVSFLLTKNVLIDLKDNDGNSALHLSAMNGYSATVRILVKAKADVNCMNNIKWTPLFIALGRGSKEVVNILLKAGARTDIKYLKGSTALHLSCALKNKDIANLLIQEGTDVNALDDRGQTPLHLAACNGDIEIIELLLKNDSNLHCADKDGLNVLHLGVSAGNLEVVKYLVAKGCHLHHEHKYGLTLLHVAAQCGHVDLIQFMIDEGCNINATDEKGNTPLHFAVKKNNAKMVKCLIDKGATIGTDKTGEPLLSAIISGKSEIVEIFLRKLSFDISMYVNDNCTFLFIAAMHGHWSIANILIRHGADIDAGFLQFHQSPLYIAAEKGHHEIVELLLSKGANVDSKALDGSTPLIAAARNGHTNIIQMLLNWETDFKIRDFESKSVVEMTVERGNLSAVKLLIDRSKEILNDKYSSGQTALHIAVNGGIFDIVKYLTENGSNINARDNSGLTPVHLAALKGHKSILKYFYNHKDINNIPDINKTALLKYAIIGNKVEIVKYLIECKADINMQDPNSGLRPLHLSAKHGCKNIVEILIKSGAFYNAPSKLLKTPSEVSSFEDISKIFSLCSVLFKAVKSGNNKDVRRAIENGAIVDTVSNKNSTPLLIAVCKGYEEIVELLLNNGANPNIAVRESWTALHYASKFSRTKSLLNLLIHGAIYDFPTTKGNIPLDFSISQDNTEILRLISESFAKVQSCDTSVIMELCKWRKSDVIKAVYRTQNRERRNIIVLSILNKFPFEEQEILNSMVDENVYYDVQKANELFLKGQYANSFDMYNAIFKRRADIIGLDNPITLVIQEKMAVIYFKQQKYTPALNLFQIIYKIFKEILGNNERHTLNARSYIAMMLHHQGKSNEALTIFKEVYSQLKVVAGTNDLGTLRTGIFLSEVLNELGYHKNALIVYNEVMECHRDVFKDDTLCALQTRSNIALILQKLNKDNEALNDFQEIYEAYVKELGPNHRFTLRALSNVAGLHAKQRNFGKAIAIFRQVLVIQNTAYGPNDLETLNTQVETAHVLTQQSKHLDALKIYLNTLDQRKRILGPNHPEILKTLENIQNLDFCIKLRGASGSVCLKHVDDNTRVERTDSNVRVEIKRENLIESDSPFTASGKDIIKKMMESDFDPSKLYN